MEGKKVSNSSPNFHLDETYENFSVWFFVYLFVFVCLFSQQDNSAFVLLQNKKEKPQESFLKLLKTTTYLRYLCVYQRH